VTGTAAGWSGWPSAGPGILIGENLTNLGDLWVRAEAFVLPIPIAGADGSPARVLSRPRSGAG
jgi:kynurenine formamidase